MQDSILIVDDETRFLELYRQVLESEGLSTRQATSADEAYALIQESTPLMVVTDVRMPGASGIDLLRNTRKTHAGVPFLIITAYTDVRDAVRVMKYGAVDYLAKPVDLDEFIIAVKDVLQIPTPGLKSIIPPKNLSGIVLKSPVMQSVINDAYRVAASDANVLILGESGVGKEIVARFIHQCSSRCNNSMVTVNCAAMPATLLASDLFGHEKGAFTGAQKSRKGHFRMADGGTLFLDEIGDMPLELQPVLLRAIETGRIIPVGGDEECTIDFRLLSATNRKLPCEVKEGRFRQDLYYRLNVIAIDIPPIRERREDIVPLAQHFLSQDQTDAKTLSRSATMVLKGYQWPGNIREISNAMEHARLLSPSTIIGPEHLPPVIRNSVSRCRSEKLTENNTAGIEIKTLKENEIDNIRRALKKTHGNRTHAAELLGVSRRGLIHKLKRYGIL